ncbi:hypothetical protein LEMA_P031950.1 [Plenodomus lingam JN3]|uniref:Putative zinc-finger domain-containing protein n=2 Tax=Leptosphaeria maculans TaxID=5022 RepID=E4ZWR7_LEPMJ|nr:hypothetical protein LEMA_P031950.1 [Plenodomus lingam JN3]CBX96043.1 hypothetical protein LEMA_P031950.1 [Plenodomus lingam JN3]
MAYNSHQPPGYGSPFAFSHPRPQQSAPGTQSDGHQGHSHVQHAPAPNVFPSIPGLQQPPPALPGFNFASYSQNNQQQLQYPPAGAWPQQLPPDPQTWMSMFQQHGMFPPPPMPGVAGPLPSLPQAPQHHTMPMRFPPPPPPPQSYPQPTMPAGGRIQEVTDSDREDGELSESNGASRVPSTGKAPMGTPRSMPQVTSAARRVEEAYNPDRPAVGQTPSKPSAAANSRPKTPPSLEKKVQKDREEAKQFIKTLNSSGIGYRVLAQEPLDAELLRGLYQSLNLPSEPAQIALPNGNANATAKSAAEHLSNQSNQPVDNSKPKQAVPVVKTNAVSSMASKAAASPVTRGDRTDYIARLQAARMAKQAAEAKPSTPQQTSQANSTSKSATTVPAVQASQATPTPAVKTSITDEQRRARTTELVKQRLKELKGQPKSAPPVKENTVSEPLTKETVQPPSAPTQNTIPATATSDTRANRAPITAFPGIPGLFMNNQQQHVRETSTPVRPTSSIPQKRSAPSDSTGASTPHSCVTPYSRPLGQSPHAPHDEGESMIIQVSDDESNGSDMDLDDDEPGQKLSSGSIAITQNRSQDVGTPSSLPPRPGSAKPASSTFNTSGPQTPSTQAREKELENKEKQLAAMRLTLKKKLAEKREKDRAAAAAAVAATTVTTSSPLRQQSSTSGPHPEEGVVQKSSYMAIDSGGSPAKATRAIADSGRDHKHQRRAELQSQLPTLDAEIANNASRMARLTEEMNKLVAENEKITKAKAQLTRELEDLGIDTEGMSHAQLKAKKDEIERENSPEKEASSQEATMASNSSGESQTASTTEPAVAAAPGPSPPELSTNSNTFPNFTGLPGLGPPTPLLPKAMPEEPPKSKSPILPDDAVNLRGPQSENQSQNLDSNKAEPTRPEDIVAVERGSATPLDDEEDFYSPPPPDEMDLDIERTAEAAPQIPVDPTASDPISPSEEGEVEMSESVDEAQDEEDYEPGEPAIETKTALQVTDASGIDAGRSLVTSQDSTEDEEDYEPPDIDREMPEVDKSIATAGSGNTMPPAEGDDDEMDMSTSLEESSNSNSDLDEEITSEPDSILGPNVSPPPTGNAGTLARGWQVTDAADTYAVDSVAPVEDKDEAVRFTPYESPLRMFKSYRYHPRYASEVSGGFLSWTFSHQIDPQKLLCQYESAGGSCNDSTCTDQHFRDISITGEKLLVQLGTANPGETAEERQRWNDGLRGVLKELRVKNIKDPNGIAAEIAKYRRHFLNDETRVVSLPPAGQ